MIKRLYSTAIIYAVVSFALMSDARTQPRILVLNFDTYGEARAKSSAIGDSLRLYLRKDGAGMVSRNLFLKLAAEKKQNESDLNYTVDNLKTIAGQLGADAAVYGHVLSAHGLLTVELRYLEPSGAEPFIFEPIVCSDLGEVYELMPVMSELILSPDKNAPRVISVSPAEGSEEIEQYVDLVITFSKPMNPATFSISAKPEDMWKRYGDVTYEDKTNSFNFKLHLYPEIEYEFCVNGPDAKGFKDYRGNVAVEYTWKFKTGKW